MAGRDFTINAQFYPCTRSVYRSVGLAFVAGGTNGR